MAKYRVPVFRELASRKDISVFLAYGNRAGLTNVEPDGFDGQMIPLTRKKLGPLPIYWHSPQIGYAKKKKSDVIVLTWNSQYLSLLPGIMRAKMNRVGTVVWGHGYSKRESGMRLAIRKWIARLSHSVMFYDFHTAERYVNQFRFKKEKVFTAPNSIDQTAVQNATKHWQQQPEDLIEFQKSKGIADSPVLLFVSRLHPDNQLDKLIEATARLANDFPKIKTAIVGKGAEETTRLQGLAKAAGVEERFIFTGPIYDELELSKWFLSSVAFCYPANIGLSILHAFGYGVPVVTSDNIAGQNPEIFSFEDDKNGLFYADGNVDDMTNKLRQIISDSQLQSRLSKHALETVQSRFNIPRMVDGMEAAIRYAHSKVTRSK